MHLTKAVLLVALVGCALAEAANSSCTANKLAAIYNKRNKRALEELQARPQIPERYLAGSAKHVSEQPAGHRVTHFESTNCGAEYDPVQFESISITPDPLSLPGEIGVQFDVTSDVEIISPVRMEVAVFKKHHPHTWLSVPCNKNVGSCVYEDICPFLPDPCPPAFFKQKIPCHCPFPNGTFFMPVGSKLDIHTFPFPSWMTSGDYQVKIHAFVGGVRLFCRNTFLSLK